MESSQNLSKAKKQRKRKKSHAQRLRQRKRQRERLIERKKKQALSKSNTPQSMESTEHTNSMEVQPSSQTNTIMELISESIPIKKPPRNVINLNLAPLRIPVPAVVMDALKGLLLVKGDYAPCTQREELHEFICDALANALSTEFQLSIEQIVGIRRILMNSKSMKRFRVLKRSTYAICRMYKNGKGILDISKELDLPPVACFRTMLQHRNLSKNQIKLYTRNPDSLPSPRDVAEMWDAAKNDSFSVQNEHAVLEQAKKFESELETSLLKLGIRFTTEGELLKAHTTKMNVYKKKLDAYDKLVAAGKAKPDTVKPVKPTQCLTPDILVESTLTINGNPVNWIDAKSYFGMDSFLTTGTLKQISKYTDRWGPGAVIFKLGYSKDFHDFVTEKSGSILIDFVDIANLAQKLS